MKGIKLFVAFAVIASMFSITANAKEGWNYVPRGGRWWYDYGYGMYPSNEWVWLDGNDDGIAECYCFDWEGYLYMNGWTPDGYYVNSDGAWTVNGVVQIQDLDKLADDYYYGYRY